MFELYYLLDSSINWQMTFQDPASPVMEGIINLHHDLMFFIVFVFFFVLIAMARTLYYFTESEDNVELSRTVTHGTILEIV